MTTAAQVRRAGPYVGSGTTGPFSFAFKTVDANDITVYTALIADGTEALVSSTLYTVTLNSDQETSPGGTVTLNTALTSSYELTIVDAMDTTQSLNPINGGAWNPVTLAGALDRLSGLVQRERDARLRGFKVAETDDDPGTLPAKDTRKSSFLAFDANGVMTAAVGTLSGSTVTAFMDTVLAAGTAAAARALLVAGSDTELQLLRSSGPYNVKDPAYGAVGDGIVDDSVAIQDAIDACSAAGGGTVFFPAGSYLCNTPLDITGASVRLLGETCGSTAIFSTATSGYILQFTGTRHELESLLVYRNTMHTNVNSVPVKLFDAVQFKMDRCWIQGGYYNLLITGTATSDCVFTRSIFTFSTGAAMVLIARNGAGINGGHHFYRCLMNQGYGGTVTPVAADFKGARANSTAYALNEVVTQGSFYYICTTAGTSAGSAPAGMTTPTVFYGVNITDGSATWAVMCFQGYRGLHVDTGISFVRFRECDLTGPFTTAIDITNSLAGDKSYEIQIIDCTAHGPISNGLQIGEGYEIKVGGFNTFAPTGSGTTFGIVAASTAGPSIMVRGSQAYGFTTGIHIGCGGMQVSDNACLGCTDGIAAAANITHFTIVNNNAGSSSVRGANTVGIRVNTGTSDFYTITGNQVNGATTGVSDAGSGGTKTVSGNL